MEEQREAVKAAYLMLREHYPALPEQLRDFQADIVRCAIDGDETSHIMGALPTGYGKSLPMIVTGLLMPPGSTVIIVSALTAIAQQLLSDCQLYGIEALSSNQLSPGELKEAMELHPPRLMICSVEFLASEEVRSLLLDCPLAPHGRRPIVAIDEAQVLDPEVGWSGFREHYGTSTWRWLTAATKARFLLLSASMSELSLLKISATLGIDRRQIQVFYKDPSRLNVFQQVRSVDRISTSNFDRTCGFLYLFALSGKKIQVFCRSTDLVWRVEGWLKGRLEENGYSSIKVRRLDGNSTQAQKKKTMDDFRSGYVSVLFCTEVAAMGVHCPDLCLGVSLGAWTSRWKSVQSSGRVGRNPSQSAAYITVFEKKVVVRAAPAERVEAKTLRGIYSSADCLRASLYRSFQIENPSVTYKDILTAESQERCLQCYCCSACQDACRSCGSESEDETIMRILGIDKDSEIMKRAEENRQRFVREEEQEMDSEEEMDTEGDVEGGDDDEEEEEGIMGAILSLD